ncbi:MAG: UvrD-helicase domain-containing protein [Bacteroidales bacterium]|nr:UvrD-helicase domain-containing protein [Bacteroidales bacterium]
MVISPTNKTALASLKIIRASAGSGKTFSLTHEYLRLLFAERDNFMHILAVTFTNKATEEMKSRIILELFMLSTGKPSKQLNGLVHSTKLSEKQIREKAKVILKRLLHNYSRFSVSTIDSFFQRIIRGFTRELGIQNGYAIELDTDILLTEIINRLLLRAETDNSLLSWLTKYAESLIEKGESWNLKNGIRTLGSEIFREEFRSFEEEAIQRFSDRDLLKKYNMELYALVNRIGSDYRNFGIRAKTILNASGLSEEDFSGKARGPAGFLLKLETGEFKSPTVTATSAVTSPEKWYTANSPLKSRITDVASKDLIPLMKEAISYYEKNSRVYFTARLILKNLYALGILTDLSELAVAWCNENNTFLLSQAPVFLNRIIAGNDTPFIYEKAGYWYHHFMIDEFQDTSFLQWLNFKPLISNSLSQDFDNLTVGDVKQSIYRWRNSNWEILQNYIIRDFPPGITRAVTHQTNWRSKPEIIGFNNRFFRTASEILQQQYDQARQEGQYFSEQTDESVIAGLYGDIDQKPIDSNSSGGFVQVSFLDADDGSDFSDRVQNQLVNMLRELQDKGYHLSDIAVLTRKNSEAKQLADFLMKHAHDNPDPAYRFDVISDEALRLGSSTLVTFMISLLQYCIDPTDRTNIFLHQWIFKTYISPGESLEQPNYSQFIEKLVSFSLSEITERIIAFFGLERFKGESVYLQAFRDLILEYAGKSSGDISRFLEHWEDKGKEKSVSAPSNQDALRIITIHKSKGLEFKIVIIPFCTWELNSYRDIFLWCKPQEKPFNQIDLLPLNFSAQLKDTLFTADYFREYQHQLIDNLNLLYVSFTRAREGLFVICKSGDHGPLRTVSDLARQVLGGTGFTTGTLVSKARLESPKVPAEKDYQPVSIQTANNRIKIAFQGKLSIDPNLDKPARPLHEGKILHDIFTRIQNAGDVRPAVDRLLLQGHISRSERDKYIQLIERSISNPDVSTWFSDDWKTMNEAEIVLPGGDLKRPDRVMVRHGRTLVVDYKFGALMESVHENQVTAYARLMQIMGYENVEAFLWYVRLGKVVSCKL